MKKILIYYWHGTKFADLEWMHNTQHEYSKELRTQVIDTCLEKGYSVMIRPMSTANSWEFDGEAIFIDKGRFGQK